VLVSAAAWSVRGGEAVIGEVSAYHHRGFGKGAANVAGGAVIAAGDVARHRLVEQGGAPHKLLRQARIYPAKNRRQRD
jgi:hypothetical protein